MENIAENANVNTNTKMNMNASVFKYLLLTQFCAKNQESIGGVVCGKEAEMKKLREQSQ